MSLVSKSENKPGKFVCWFWCTHFHDTITNDSQQNVDYRDLHCLITVTNQIDLVTTQKQVAPVLAN